MIGTLLASLIMLCFYNQLPSQKMLLDEEKIKLKENNKPIRNYLSLIVFIGGVLTFAGILYFNFKYLFVILFFGLPILLFIVMLIIILTSAFQYKQLKQLNFSKDYLRKLVISRFIVIVFFIIVIINSIISIPQPIIKRTYYLLSPKDLETTHLNYWVCPQIVKCSQNNCIGEGGYGKFQFENYNPNLQLPNGTYEFASGEVRIRPPVLFCEYGTSVPGFGPGRIDVIALAKGSFTEGYAEALMKFNDKWHRDKTDNNRIYCGLDFGSFSIDCKFLPLR